MELLPAKKDEEMIITICDKQKLFMIWDTKNRLTPPIFEWFTVTGQTYATQEIYVGF